jgi:hypothetical protein
MAGERTASLADLIGRMLADEEAGWNAGTFGAIAEFHHVEGDPPPRVRRTVDGGAVVTTRGALRVALIPEVRAVAYEGLSARADAWTHGVAFCLPARSAAMGGRTALSELGPDAGAIRPEDRDAVLFDLGLGAPHVDFCVRTADPALIEVLRGHASRSLFDPGNPAMEAIKTANPHRLCVSRLVRIEVYQHIGSHRRGIPAPIGPHTHMLPDLLARRRTHSANIPVPEGWTPALNLHPANPLTDRLGRPRPFDPGLHRPFQELLAAYGPPGTMEEKARITVAVLDGLAPEAYGPAATRAARKGARVALRQLLHTHPDVPGLDAWLAAIDRGVGTRDTDGP